MLHRRKVVIPEHCKYHVPCQEPFTGGEKLTPGKIPNVYEALPRDTTFTYMPPSYYAKGFRILPVYRQEFDFTEMKKLFFLDDKDPKMVAKWGNLRTRIPYPEIRVVDLPGTRDLHYKNYCLRSLTPESASSWRKSIHNKIGSEKRESKAEEEIKRDESKLADDPGYKCDHLNCPFKKNIDRV